MGQYSCSLHPTSHTIALIINQAVMTRFTLLAVALLAAYASSRREVDPNAYVPTYLNEVDYYIHDSYIQQRGFNWVFFWCHLVSTHSRSHPNVRQSSRHLC